MVALTFGAFGVFAALPIFWTLPTAILSGATAAAGIAAINSIGNLSGYFGPFVIGWIKDATGSFAWGLAAVAACAAAALVIALALGHDPRAGEGAGGGRRRRDASPCASTGARTDGLALRRPKERCDGRTSRSRRRRRADRLLERPGARRWLELAAKQDLVFAPIPSCCSRDARLAPGERVIDVGCGGGGTTIERRPARRRGRQGGRRRRLRR